MCVSAENTVTNRTSPGEKKAKAPELLVPVEPGEPGDPP